MRKLIVLLIGALVIMAGIAYAKDYEVTKKTGAYTVVVKNDKNPPVAGDNNLTISIKDASDKNVTDAKVKVEYSMPAMSGMPPMNYKTNAVLKGSDYNAKMNLSMAGSWNIAIKIAKGGKSETMKFTVDAH
jgi:hypothetical protein